MKKLLILLVLATTFSCSKSLDCNCSTDYYQYRIVRYENNGTTAVWQYVLQTENPPVSGDCSEDTGARCYLFIGSAKSIKNSGG